MEADYQYRTDVVTKKVTQWDVRDVYDKIHHVPGRCTPSLLPYREESCWLWEILRKYRDRIIGRRGLVLGSRYPWVESMLLGIGLPEAQANQTALSHGPVGAAQVVTVEYGRIEQSHPQLTTLLPSEVVAQYNAQTWRPVDFAVSFSSVEHSGLGRYGDPLLPHADLEAIAQLWCLCGPNCTLFLGVPTHRHRSILFFNLHRMYGPQRLKHLTANWRVLDVYPDWNNFTTKAHHQPTWVLQRQHVM